MTFDRKKNMYFSSFWIFRRNYLAKIARKKYQELFIKKILSIQIDNQTFSRSSSSKQISKQNIQKYHCNLTTMLQVDAHAEECFFDKVKQGTKMSLMFEVAEGGFLDIDVRIEGKNLATTSPWKTKNKGKVNIFDNIVLSISIIMNSCMTSDLA